MQTRNESATLPRTRPRQARKSQASQVVRTQEILLPLQVDGKWLRMASRLLLRLLGKIGKDGHAWRGPFVTSGCCRNCISRTAAAFRLRLALQLVEHRRLAVSLWESVESAACCPGWQGDVAEIPIEARAAMQEHLLNMKRVPRESLVETEADTAEATALAFQRYRAFFRRSTAEQQEAEATLLFGSVRNACRASDVNAVCQLLLRAASWASKPRLESKTPEAPEEPEEAKPAAKAKANSQAIIRRTILRCLEFLSLEKESEAREDVQLAKARLSNLLAKAQLEVVACRKTWKRIAVFVDLDLDDVGERKARKVGNIIGLDVAWTPDLDQQMVNLLEDGLSWGQLEEVLGRSARWLKRRHRQLQRDPNAACPAGGRDSSHALRVGHRALARAALARMPKQRGTVYEICDEILRLDAQKLQHLNWTMCTGPTRTQVQASQL